MVQVDPTIVDGVQYAGVSPTEVTLGPGASSAAPVVLKMTARLGTISGGLSGPPAAGAVNVRAIRLSDGVSVQTNTDSHGRFAFTNLPVSEYLVAADQFPTGRESLPDADQTVDLHQNISQTVTIARPAEEGDLLRGTVRDADGGTIPFAWLSIDRSGIYAGVLPDSGQFVLAGLPAGQFNVIASAPGYYSQAELVQNAAGMRPSDVITLTRRPGTRALPWGSGEVIVPPDSQARVEAGHITLTQGWLWGQSGSDQPLTVDTPTAAVTIRQGRFAIEQALGQSGWLYVMDGEATVSRGSAGNGAAVRANQMIAMGAPTAAAVPLDPNVVAAFHPAAAAPIAPVWPVSLSARVSAGLRDAGIGAAQGVTLSTYSAAVLSLVVAPLAGIIWWWRRRARRPAPGNQ
ncbi:MAG: carboxypeptidase-like regulatory domain-containing protein [Chloroflexi bacterium]|nr:carboxypeptidase-like regulatory domain-containing protein [Chloroflexota bacterium]